MTDTNDDMGRESWVVDEEEQLKDEMVERLEESEELRLISVYSITGMSIDGALEIVSIINKNKEILCVCRSEWIIKNIMGNKLRWNDRVINCTEKLMDLLQADKSIEVKRWKQYRIENVLSSSHDFQKIWRKYKSMMDTGKYSSGTEMDQSMESLPSTDQDSMDNDP
ncbi:hypothetical protein SNEBB_002343, partial [Seison nebaliae]